MPSLKPKLSQKQNEFCNHYVLLGNASEAYRKSYNAIRMSSTTINSRSCELMKNGKITARINELQQQAQDKFEITLEGQVSRYLHLFNRAEYDVEDPKQKIELMVKILSRLDKIGGLENHNLIDNQRDIIIRLDEKDMPA